VARKTALSENRTYPIGFTISRNETAELFEQQPDVDLNTFRSTDPWNKRELKILAIRHQKGLSVKQIFNRRNLY